MENHIPLHWEKEELKEKPKNSLEKNKTPFLVKLAIALVIFGFIYNIAQKEFVRATIDLIFGMSGIVFVVYRGYKILEKTKNLTKKEQLKALYKGVAIIAIILYFSRLLINHYLL